MTTRAERPLTAAERALLLGMFGVAVDPEPVRIRPWRWFPFQPSAVAMAPMGHLHIAPRSPAWRDCYATATPVWQAFFLHEMMHVLQAQERGRWYLPLMRHPWCRYAYRPDLDRPFDAYGLEQQAEIVRHTHLARTGHPVTGKPGPVLEAILPARFRPGEPPSSARAW